MYTKELFHRSISVLAGAYLNDTLEHGNYCACAVGNLLAERVGAKIVRDKPDHPSQFSWVHDKFHGGEWFANHNKKQRDSLICNIEYSWSDILRIEKSFERCKTSNDKDENMFNGLMSVVDVLCEIHGMNEEEKKESKTLFVKV